jgi:hypothetical protein
LTVAACSSVLFLSATAFAQQAPAVAAPAPAPLRMAFVDLQRVAARLTVVEHRQVEDGSTHAGEW